ncbi:MAG: PD-(D/E)XK nuclease family protein [Nanoarchaeota archaeon]
MADPGVISASKITTYKGCPLSYYFTYVLKPKIEVPQAPAKIFGAEIHVMLQKFYRKEDNKSFKKSPFTYQSKESFLNAWKYRWWFGVVKNGFEKYPKVAWSYEKQPGYFYGLGYKILSAFYDHYINLPLPKEVEKPFNGEFRGHKVRGVFDRINIRNGEHYIIDYKTDKRSPKEDKFLLNRHPQFTIYSAIYEQMHRDELNGERPTVGYHHLRSGYVFKTKRDEGDYDYLEKLIISTKSGIEKDDFIPFYGFHCPICEYIPVCKRACIDVGSKLKELETISSLEVETIDWLSYPKLIKQNKSKFDIIVENLSSDLQKFLISQFESFFDLGERAAKNDPEAKEILEKRKEALDWIKYAA